MPGSGLRAWESRHVASVQSPRSPRAAWLMSGAGSAPLASAPSLQRIESGQQSSQTLLSATSGMGSGMLLETDDGCGLALAARTANGRLQHIIGGTVQVSIGQSSPLSQVWLPVDSSQKILQ